MDSTDSLALMVNDLPDHLALEVLKHACKIKPRSNNGQAQKSANYAANGTLRNNSKPLWWMCRNCCELGHDEEDCENDPDLDRERKF